MKLMNYEKVHAEFIEYHLARREGERRSRLERGHGHAEQLFCRNVWWKMAGNFDHLHPEYEVRDWRGRSYFADFAWITDFVQLLIEIKGYKTHIEDMDREKFCQSLNREAFLVGAGYHIISFAYDDVKDRPDVCIHLLRMFMGRYQPEPDPTSIPLLAEREIVRLSLKRGMVLTMKEVSQHFQVDYRTARNWLTSLCNKGWMTPVYGPAGKRILRYELVAGMLRFF